MTRDADVYVSAATRQKISTTHRAALVVSVHAAASSNPATDASLVLYPNQRSVAFAQTLSDALTAQISVDGVPGGGVVFGDAAWVHSPAPVATVDMGYLSNRSDAALMATASFRQDVAIGVRDGVEAYLPAIIARRDAIRAWRSGHSGSPAEGSLAPASAALPGTKGFQFGPVIAWLAAISVVGLVLLFRDAVARVLVVIIALVVRLAGGVMWLRRAAIRRRRRRRRVRTDVRRFGVRRSRVDAAPRPSAVDGVRRDLRSDDFTFTRRMTTSTRRHTSHAASPRIVSPRRARPVQAAATAAHRARGAATPNTSPSATRAASNPAFSRLRPMGEPQLRVPGPTPLPARVVRSASRPMINHRGPEFAAVMDDVISSLRWALRTDNDILLYPCSGTGGLEAAAVNLLSPGEQALFCVMGSFGERWAKIGDTYGADVVRLTVPLGEPIDPEDVERTLAEHPEITTVFVTHNETSTGVTNDLAAISGVVKSRGKMLAVDSVSGAGCLPLETDALGIDVLVTGSQKGWMAPPGIAMIAVGAAAFERASYGQEPALLPRFRTRAEGAGEEADSHHAGDLGDVRAPGRPGHAARRGHRQCLGPPRPGRQDDPCRCRGDGHETACRPGPSQRHGHRGAQPRRHA